MAKKKYTVKGEIIIDWIHALPGDVVEIEEAQAKKINEDFPESLVEVKGKTE